MGKSLLVTLKNRSAVGFSSGKTTAKIVVGILCDLLSLRDGVDDLSLDFFAVQDLGLGEVVEEVAEGSFGDGDAEGFQETGDGVEGDGADAVVVEHVEGFVEFEEAGWFDVGCHFFKKYKNNFEVESKETLLLVIEIENENKTNTGNKCWNLIF